MKLIEFGFEQAIAVNQSVTIYFEGRLVPSVPRPDAVNNKIHSKELVSLGTHIAVKINGHEMHFKDNLAPVFDYS